MFKFLLLEVVYILLTFLAMVVLSNSNPSYLFGFSFAPVTIEVISFPSYVSQIFFISL